MALITYAAWPTCMPAPPMLQPVTAMTPNGRGCGLGEEGWRGVLAAAAGLRKLRELNGAADWGRIAAVRVGRAVPL